MRYPGQARAPFGRIERVGPLDRPPQENSLTSGLSHVSPFARVVAMASLLALGGCRDAGATTNLDAAALDDGGGVGGGACLPEM